MILFTGKLQYCPSLATKHWNRPLEQCQPCIHSIRRRAAAAAGHNELSMCSLENEDTQLRVRHGPSLAPNSGRDPGPSLGRRRLVYLHAARAARGGDWVRSSDLCPERRPGWFEFEMRRKQAMTEPGREGPSGQSKGKCTQTAART